MNGLKIVMKGRRSMRQTIILGEGGLLVAAYRNKNNMHLIFLGENG
jgi:hypothetical protein